MQQRRQNPHASRIAITGFYAGFRRERQWIEFSSRSQYSLRSAFEQYFAPCPPAQSRQLPALEFDAWSDGVLQELRAAGLWAEEALTVDPQRVAVSFAASKGRVEVSAKEAYLSNALTATCDWPARALARQLRITGPLLSPVAACTTGAHAVAMGAHMIENGYADVAVVGSLENGLTDLVLAAYKNLGALSSTGIMRPFDRQRDGFIPAEGVGCLVLEAEEHAQARGATLYGYLTGWAIRADATSMTAMDADGDSIARAIEAALQRAGNPALDYVNAHGTATKLNDKIETRGIKQSLGSSVPVSATKPLTGHLLGAAGAVEAILCLLAMRENYAPPTLHLQEPDEECDLDYIPGQGRTMSIKNALSLSYGFGGHCGVLVFNSEV